MKKKVLFILHIPPPINGAAVMGEIVKKSDVLNSTFETDYINLTTSFSLDKIGKSSKTKILTILTIQYNIVRALIIKKYDICYMTLTASGPGFYKDVLMVLILKLFRKKIIYHFHNKGVRKNSERRLNRSLYRFVFKKTQSILLSPNLYSDIAYYVPKSNVHFCPNGIPDVQGFAKITSQDSLVTSPVKFLYLSNMMVTKGVFELLKACKILKQRKVLFECHFVGAWSEISKEEFFQQVEELELSEQVFAHGKKYGEDKISFFEETDVFVFPSFYDCFPLVLLEAMQYSIPVISTYHGGIPTLVSDQKTGVLVPIKNSEKLADAMDFLSDNPKLRMKMGIEGRTSYENLFTVAQFEKRLKSILQEAML